jgi:hypothetical protein
MRRRTSVTWLTPVWVFAVWAGACSPASERQPRERPVAAALDGIPTEASAAPNGMPHEEHARVVEEAPAPSPAPGVLGASAQQGKARYPLGALQSPLTENVVSRLQAVLASSGNWRNTFIKVGDSHSTSPSFLECFSSRDFRLGDHDALETARTFFHGWARESLAAKVGWHAVQTLGAPIRDEVSAMHPGFAIVMLGTNDTRQTPADKLEHYLAQNVDTLLSLGVVPIVTTIPPRGDGDEVEKLVPEVNTIIRAVAQSRQVPLIDLYAALAPLGGLGLAHDGIHMSVFSGSGTEKGQHGCWLDEESLGAGMNQRNLLTLTALERMRRFVIGGEKPEIAPPMLVGAGTFASPLQVDALPFADDGATTTIGSTTQTYPCSDRVLDGGEVVYQLELPVETRLRIRVLADPTADLDLHWLDGEGADTCEMHADRALEITAPAGSHRLVIDGPAAKAGSYRLTIVPVEI